MADVSELVFAWRKHQGEPLLLATVVGTKGSTYRKTGARMLMTPTQWLAGSISGGCLEADLLENGWDKTVNGPVLVTYDATSDDDILWGFGLGCKGKIDVLLERISESGGILELLAQCLEQRRPLEISTNLTGDLGKHQLISSCEPNSKLKSLFESLLAAKTAARVEVDGEEFLIERILSPKPLVIFGAGNDAIPLVGGAAQLGWHVTVIDPRPDYAAPARFPSAQVVSCPWENVLDHIPQSAEVAAVLMTHNYLHDLAILRLLLPLDIPYLGVLGPRRRADRLLGDIRREISLSAGLLAKLHAPIGLDIGAEGAHEIALSVLAEILAVSRSKQGGLMSDTVVGCELSA